MSALPRLFSHRLNLALLTVLLLLLVIFFMRTELSLTRGRVGVPLDDAWIHYQFARNLAQGDGFSYNPGEPTPGSTAPLWTLLLAGVGLFTSDFLIPSLVLSALFLLLTSWLTYGFTLELTGEGGTIWAFLAGAAVLMTGRLLWAGLAGMETTAFAAASLAAVWLYHRQGLRPLPVLLLALAAQLRPEGHALFALALADTVWANRHTLPQMVRPVASALLLYGLIAAPYTLFSLFTTGHPLPNTFYAKAGSQYFFSWRSLRETVAYHWQDNPVAFVLMGVGLLAAARKNRLLFAWLIGLPLFTALIVDQIWHHGRYTMPLIPFQMVAAALGAAWIAQKASRTPPGEPGEATGRTASPAPASSAPVAPPLRTTQYAPRITRRAIPLLLLLLTILGGAYRLPYWAGMLGYNSNEILAIDVAMGQWLAENTPPDALIAVDDIGAITFISQRRILDLQGLVSPEMWPVTRNEPEGRPRNEAATRLLSTLQPDYLAIFPLWHWELATNPLVAAPVQSFTVDTHSIIFSPEAMVYRATWPYLDAAAPQVEHVVPFGEAIQLVGYDLAPPATLDQPLALTLYWQSLSPVADGYDVFVHVMAEEGTIVAQADQEPVAGLAPTHRWQPGDLIRDPYTIFLPADLPPGNYRINVGMYLKASGVRLPIPHPNATDNALTLTTFVWER